MQTFYCLFLSLILSSCFQYSGTSNENILAKVNQRFISMDDFEAQRSQLSEFKAMDTQSISAKKKLLEDLVFQELVFQQAIDQDFHLSNLNVKQTVVDAFLKQKFKAQIEKINETSIQDYYDKNQTSLDRIRASHILIKFDPEDPDTQDKTLAKIQNIQKQIQRDPSRFEALAKKHSQDGSAAKGGDLGYFTKGRMVKPFEDEAFDLSEPGKISDIVKTQFGYHIIQLNQREVGYPLHREKIRNHLIQTLIMEKTNTYKSELKGASNVTIYHERLQDPKNPEPSTG